MIYFLQAGSGGYVKIGWTQNETTLRRRVATLQTGQPFVLSLIRTINADRWAEGWLHGFYAGLRAAGEWFGYRDDMLTVAVPSRNPAADAKERKAPARSERLAARVRREEAQLLGDSLAPGSINPIAELRQACTDAGSQAAWANANGVSQQYVHDVLARRGTPGPAILTALGLRLATWYERVEM